MGAQVARAGHDDRGAAPPCACRVVVGGGRWARCAGGAAALLTRAVPRTQNLERTQERAKGTSRIEELKRKQVPAHCRRCAAGASAPLPWPGWGVRRVDAHVRAWRKTRPQSLLTSARRVDGSSSSRTRFNGTRKNTTEVCRVCPLTLLTLPRTIAHARTHVRTHARTHARTRTHTHTHAHTHAHSGERSKSAKSADTKRVRPTEIHQ